MLDGFSVFKKGIRPEWEDAANRSGAELVARKTMRVEECDVYWENLVLALIGETMDEGDEICGGRIVDKSKRGNPRTLFKIEIWLRSNNPEIAERIRLKLMDVLSDGDIKAKGLPEFSFMAHKS